MIPEPDFNRGAHWGLAMHMGFGSQNESIWIPEILGILGSGQAPARRSEICGNEAHLHHIPIGRVAHTVLGRQDHQPVEWAPVNAFLALFRPFGTS